MLTLLSLPAELRQRIVAFALPPTFCRSEPWPRCLLNLLQISHRLRSDTIAVLRTWSPLNTISFPSTLHRLAASAIVPGTKPKLERLSLQIFYEANIKNMTWTCYCAGPDLYSHPELVAAWIRNVRYLPLDGIHTVHLDVTPAPVEKRQAHPFVLNMFVSDKRCAKTFLSCHIKDVAALVCAMDAHYSGNIEICLTGILSRKSEFFPDAVQKEAGRDVPFVGTWVEQSKANFPSLAHAVSQVTPRKPSWNAKKKGAVYQYKWLRAMDWPNDTAWAFALAAWEGQKNAAAGDVLTIAEFEMDENRGVLEMQAVIPLRRALQHKVARDMGLKTKSEGEGSERRVVVRKE